jgi:hypothetical protein
MFKLSNKMGPKSLTDLFTFKSEKTNYKLRDVESSYSLLTTAAYKQPEKKFHVWRGTHLELFTNWN